MDIWRCGFVRASASEVIAAGGLANFKAEWLPLPERRFAFRADPFGIIRDGTTYIFVEELDYRDRRGRIEVSTFDPKLNLVDCRTCLEAPWHLSYPMPIEWEGDIFLLPEAHRSGGLVLYRAAEFPYRWQPHARLDLPVVPIDATPLFNDGRWWLFYGAAGRGRHELHLAFADRLTGPWWPHPQSPVHCGADGSRPGGTPIRIGDRVLLPVQDCSTTYGGSIRLLEIERLSTDRFEASIGSEIKARPSFSPFIEGLHTLSECGPITLFDAKRIDRSISGWLIGRQGKARRAARKWLSRSVEILPDQSG